MKKILFIASLFIATNAWAGNVSKGGINLDADTLQYNQKTDVVTAGGNVIATHKATGDACNVNIGKKKASLSKAVGFVGQGTVCSRTLKADTIIYDRKKNLITAEGNIELTNDDGSIYHAENLEITGDFKKGLLNNFEGELINGSSFTAEKVNYQEDKTKLKKASYTSCKRCEKRPPIWEIKARKILYNNAKQEVLYNDAWLEAYGIPVFYTPYFYHPTPDADRRSGFLIPKYEYSSDLGMQLSTPYYVNLAPSYDATLTPRITTKEGMVVEGEFRHLLPSGSYELAATGTYPRKRDADGNKADGHEFRGHIEGRGNFNINEDWRWGFDGKRSSDDTYLEKYGYAYQDTLTSQVFVDRQDERSFFSGKSITFQGLREDDDPSTTPLIMPLLDYHYESEPMLWDSKFIANINGLSLFRDVGNDVNRVSLEGGWIVPKIINGHALEAGLWLRGDMYRIDDEWGNTDYEERIIPTAYLSWRYPLIRRAENNSLLIEPIVELVATPNNINDIDIPNDDSQTLEFSDTNLFTRNRYAGYDVVESGVRLNYGLRYRWDVQENHKFNGLIGQYYGEDDDEIGMEEGFSYVVGRIGYEYDDIFSFNYRFTLDNETFSSKRSEITSKFTLSPVTLGVDYISIKEDPVVPESEEILLNMAWNIDENWKIWGHARNDLQTDGMLENGVSVGYENECINVYVSYQKDYTSDRDIKGGTSISLTLELKGMK